MKKLNYEILFALVLILAAAFSRLVPHPWNFTAISAMALFSGAIFQKKWLGLVATLTALILSDAVLGFHNLTAWVYIPTILTVGLGVFVQSESAKNYFAKSVLFRNFVLVLTSSFLFFVVSNFGVWFEGSYYSKDLNGLIECYVMALPFVKNQIAGDLFFSTSLFAAYSVVVNYLQKKAQTLSH